MSVRVENEFLIARIAKLERELEYYKQMAGSSAVETYDQMVENPPVQAAKSIAPEVRLSVFGICEKKLDEATNRWRYLVRCHQCDLTMAVYVHPMASIEDHVDALDNLLDQFSKKVVERLMKEFRATTPK